MKLAELALRLGGTRPPSAGEDPVITGVRLDSRGVEKGDLFVAAHGTRADGASYAAEALARGAAAILSPAPLGRELGLSPGSAWIHPAARAIAGQAAALVYGEPARGMFVAGVTGTNGKTTTAHLCGHILRTAGRRPAVLGTAGNRLADGALRLATHTTPDAPALQRLLREHRELRGDAVALEVSSHALDQDRTSGLRFDVAVFTNLTRDHLDYHGDLERYARAKQRLFEGLDRGASAVVNADDPASARMAEAARARGARVVTYSARQNGDLCATTLKADLSGSRLLLSGMGISRTEVWLPLAGRYNVENALAAAAAALLSGASPSTVLDGLATASGAPGRLERVPAGARGFTVIVDYAHTEDALRNVCRALRESLAGTGGRLIVVFGCGGDRDQGKRGPMGRVVDEEADLAIVTSDNPRGEDPARIAAAIEAGMQRPRAGRTVELDRRRAIELAIEAARPGDAVLIAGKGHESTQTIGSDVHAFDDRKVALEVMR